MHRLRTISPEFSCSAPAPQQASDALWQRARADTCEPARAPWHTLALALGRSVRARRRPRA
eukprot:2950866-Alexandrium_andersonii.AAC.1